ncbi:MAG: hypothetical protein L0G59_13055, partial [Kocuria sp.]|nr:hypothetical protein [Kocuria sp.]
TSDAPYMYFKRGGAADDGAAWIGYRHPNGTGYASLSLQDSSGGIYVDNWQGTRMGYLVMDASGTTLSSGTRRMDLYGNLLSIQTDEVYITSHLPKDSDPWLIGRVNGRLHEKSSSRRFKLIEESIETTVESFEDKLLTIEAKTWVDKTRAERIADHQTAIEKGEDPGYDLDTCGNLNRIPGVIAEDLHDAGLGVFVRYDPSGDPASVNYDAIGPALIPIIRRLRDRVDALETKLGETA